MEAVGDNDQLGNRALEPVDLEEIRRAEDSQPVERMVPEIATVSQGVKRRQERPGVASRIFLPQRSLHSLYEVTKADRVLLVFGMVPVGRLVQREAGRCMNGQQHRGVIVPAGFWGASTSS
jgi:hypothetical protein